MNEERLVEETGYGETDRLAAARVRSALRQVEAQIAEIQVDQRLFRRYDFGSDVHQIQLTALNAERADLRARLVKLLPAQRRPHRGGLRSWLLLPPMLGAVALGSLFPRRRRTTRLSATGG